MSTNSTIIHVSPVNKKIFDTIAKEELIKANPELEGLLITQNHLFTQMLRYFIGKRQYEEAVEEHGSNNK